MKIIGRSNVTFKIIAGNVQNPCSYPRSLIQEMRELNHSDEIERKVYQGTPANTLSSNQRRKLTEVSYSPYRRTEITSFNKSS